MKTKLEQFLIINGLKYQSFDIFYSIGKCYTLEDVHEIIQSRQVFLIFYFGIGQYIKTLFIHILNYE